MLRWPDFHWCDYAAGKHLTMNLTTAMLQIHGLPSFTPKSGRAPYRHSCIFSPQAPQPGSAGGGELKIEYLWFGGQTQGI